MKKFVIFAFAALLMMHNSLFAQQKELRIDGSTTVGPIVEAFVEALSIDHPEVKFSVKKTGSGDGAAALIDGRCDIAAMSRFMKSSEYKKAVETGVYPVPFAVAMDGVCVVTHPSNPVTALTSEQVRAIYQGKITNWKDYVF